MRPRRVDANQPAIVAAFRARGASVRIVSALPGALDLVVGAHGVDQRVEIKDGTKPPSARRLTPAEQAEFDGWRGRGPVVVCDAGDVEAVLRQMRVDAIRGRRNETGC